MKAILTARTVPLAKPKPGGVGIKKKLSEEEKQYIRNHHKTTSVIQMAKDMKRGTTTIYLFMDSEGLKVHSKMPWKKRANTKVDEGFFDHNNKRVFI